MAKFDAVDRLMKLATEKAAPASRREAGGPPEAQSTRAKTELPATALPANEPEAAAVPGERGRQLLGAIRPLLPAVGGALRMVDHGAVQAVARLLPLLGSVTTGRQSQPASPPASSQAAFETEKAAREEELKALRDRVHSQEEQLRRVRESLERVAAEQGSLVHQAHGLAGRSRLLSAGVLILFLLVIAEMVVLAVLLHR